MRVSLNWIRDFIELPANLTPSDYARELTLKTVEVEDVVDLGGRLAGTVVGRVCSLRVGDDSILVECDLGEHGTVEIEAPAGGLEVGSLVGVALPGQYTSFPALQGSPAPHICSATDLELGLLFPAESPDTPLVLPRGHAGQPLAEAIHYDDVVLEIDNKSLTNRPDLWGHYGIAREFSAIYSLPLRELHTADNPAAHRELVGELDPVLCPRFSATEFTVVSSAPTPLWLRSRLAIVGTGSTTPMVDISNYVMFAVGQPTHVYDADKVSLPLSAAYARRSTSITLLTGQEVELDPLMPVVHDARKVVGVAGVMGSHETSVTSATRRFILEAASFAPGPVRSASQQLNLRTEASSRYEKGLDTQRVDHATGLFLALLTELYPDARILGTDDVVLRQTPSCTVQVGVDFLAERIGQQLETEEIVGTLTRLGFEVAATRRDLEIDVPSWRSTGDVSIPEDILEEVARMRGYDSLPVKPLAVSLRATPAENRHPLDRRVREQLATRGGLQEVMTYPWVSNRILDVVGARKESTVRFDGPPAPDRDSLRPSLLASSFEAIATNVAHLPEFGIFEVGSVFTAPLHTASVQHDASPTPEIAQHLFIGLVGADAAQLFARVKGLLVMLRRHCGIVDLGFAGATVPPVWADRGALQEVTAGGAVAGFVGLLSRATLAAVGLQAVNVAACEINVGPLTVMPSRDNRFEALPEFPEAAFDLSFVVDESTPWSKISSLVGGEHPLVYSVSFVDEFRGASIGAGMKSLTLRVTLRSPTGTLDRNQLNAVRDGLITTLADGLGATLR